MTQIDQLADTIMGLKLAEHQATAARIEAEQELIRLVGVKDEGSATTRGQRYKVTTTGVMYRKVDEAALGAVRSKMSEAMFEKCFKFKPEIVTAGVKYLRDNEPELYAIAAQAIVATPGKPRVEIAVVEAQAQAA